MGSEQEPSRQQPNADYEQRVRELREGEARYMDLVANISEWVWEIDEHMRYTFCSAKAADMLGYAPAEVLGMSPYDLMSPEEARRVAGILEPIFSARERFSMLRTTLLAKDGSPVTIEVNGEPMFDAQGKLCGYWGVSRDITLQRRTEEAFASISEEWRTAFDAIGDAVMVLDPELRILHVNKASVGMLGVDSSKLLGRHCYKIVHGTGSPIPGCPAVRAASAKDRELEEIKLGDMWVQVTADPIVDESGAVRAIVHIMRDITERKRAEEERRAVEAHKRKFYRDTVSSATDGKLDICDAVDIDAYASETQVTVDVRDPSDLAWALSEVENACRAFGLGEEPTWGFALAVGEAVTNAIKHASGGHVRAGKNGDEVWVSVEDNGPGIDAVILPCAILRRGFSTKPSMGLGYAIMLDACDRILLKTNSDGTNIVLIKCLKECAPDIRAIPDTWGTIPDAA